MVTVIEGGAPNGTDLVMNEARFNPNANGQRQPAPVPVLQLGEGLGISAQMSIVPQIDETGENVCFLLMTMGGRLSEIAGFQAKPLLIAEIGRFALKDMRQMIADALAPKPEVIPA